VSKARAAVLTAPGVFEVRTFERPAVDDGALLEVEACGLCGTDLDVARGTIGLRGATIPGHEIVGTVSSISDSYAAATGLRAGQRVVVPGELHCGSCAGCLADESCIASPGTHGFLPVDLAPGLWGGYAEAMVLSARTRPLPLDPSVPIGRAALFNLLGAGYAWAVEAPGLVAGQTVVVLGPGQRGLACALAATEVGARVVAVSGAGGRDHNRLRVAASFGAEHTVDVGTDSITECVLEATGGVGVDVVIDTTPHATTAVLDAIAMTRPTGTVVLAGLKGATVDGFPTDTVALRRLTIRGVRAVSRDGFRRAIALIESGDDRLDRLATHQFGLDDVPAALAALEGDAEAIAVAITP